MAATLLSALATLGLYAGLPALLLFLLYQPYRMYKVASTTYRGKHVVITGGSQGIGKSLAELLAMDGANITIMARTEAKLKAAVADIKLKCKDDKQVVTYKSADVTNFSTLEKAMADLDSERPIDVLVTSAGQALPGYFLDMDVNRFQKQMGLNYFGTLYGIKSVVPHMVKRGRGKIVVISSAAAAIPFIGYAAYAPSKGAVAALSGVLRNELRSSGIEVSIAHPPDTESPGYDNEMKMKPKECQSISKFGDLYKAADVAASIVDGMKAGDYHIGTSDFFQNRVICALASGITPKSSWFLDILLSPVWAIVGEIFCAIMDYIASGYKKKKQM